MPLPADKYKFLNQKLLEKSNIAMLCLVGMMFGFLMSRATLSIAMIVFGANALRDVNPMRWLRERWWLTGFIWVMFYAATYFWSEDKGGWDDHFQVKLPILLLPLSFAYIPQFSLKQKKIFTVCIAAMLLGGVAYSLSFYFNNRQHYIEISAISQVLPTPAKSDHIRFSITITLFIVWCVYFFRYIESRLFSIFIIVTVIILAIYLHILAAKSGLITFYLFFLCFSIYLLFTCKKLLGLGLLVFMVSGGIAAVSYIPTLKNKIGYINWTLIEYRQGDKSGDYGDLNRLMSYNVAIDIIKQHPLIGVGTGDMLAEMKQGYGRLYPQVKPENVILPHNQFLTVALGCGLPIAALFTIWAFMPLMWLRKNRESFYFFITWLIVFMQLLIEPVLEIQFGVFVFLFFLLWQKHVLLPDNRKE